MTVEFLVIVHSALLLSEDHGIPQSAEIPELRVKCLGSRPDLTSSHYHPVELPAVVGKSGISILLGIRTTNHTW